MARIKGKYIATVEINIDYDDDKDYLLFDVIKNNIENKLTPNLLESIQDEVPGVIATVEVIQQSVDCCMVHG